jgi:hypothetical protein
MENTNDEVIFRDSPVLAVGPVTQTHKPVLHYIDVDVLHRNAARWLKLTHTATSDRGKGNKTKILGVPHDVLIL